MSENSEERLAEILEAVTQAMALLDHAVGGANRLPIRDRMLVRDHLLPPRNHLRSSMQALQRRLQDPDRHLVPRED